MKNTRKKKSNLKTENETVLNTKDRKEDRQYLRVRNVCGLLGVILPWIALFSASLSQPHPSDQWWWSISATYYQTPALVGILTPAALVLLLYIGYDTIDSIVTGLSGFFGLCVVLFPCKVAWIPAGAEVGFFQLPMEVSNVIHNVSACLFFILLALNSLFLFTRTNGEMTERKRLRNHIYRACGIAMLVIMVIFGIMRLLDFPGWTVMVVEVILLLLFGIPWLVKGRAFPFLNDEGE